jgi:hypothetical protein
MFKKITSNVPVMVRIEWTSSYFTLGRTYLVYITNIAICRRHELLGAYPKLFLLHLCTHQLACKGHSHEEKG